MAFLPVTNPPQWMLDGLKKEGFRSKCHDCGAKVGESHMGGCDTARCEATGQQRLCCGCGHCGDEKWDGNWPGTADAYKAKLVVFDTCSGRVMFDYNTVVEANIKMKVEARRLRKERRAKPKKG